MRYQDWDVLLFPNGDKASHVPLKEFRTACYVEQHNDSPHPTPLLTTFVPSLPRGSPFQISLHSWTETASTLAPLQGGVKPRERWQVRVVIDGTCVCVENFAIDANWPQVISSSAASTESQARPPLTFPHFHRTIMGQSHWDASDHLGRIRVELCGGYVEPGGGRFVRLNHSVNFAFQPAPMELLEQSGIAWPNQRMYTNPLQINTYTKNATGMFSNQFAAKHKRGVSASNLTFPASLMGYPAVISPIVQYPVASGEAISRSTSAYSSVTDSAAPLLSKTSGVPAYPGSYADAARKDQQFSVRLPSDQFQMILKAISPTRQGEAADSATASSMPPPPLPAHAMASKGTNFPEPGEVVFAPQSQHPLGSDVINLPTRRAESRYSDVSMHACCTSFPSCTSEDGEGRIVHNAPAAPATVVKGRKEGSSPTKRKYSRTYVVAGEDDYAEKKVRRSSRLLQHDPRFHGGAAHERADGDAGQSGGDAVVEPRGERDQKTD